MSEIIHGDCMDVMRDMPDKAFDLAIVDPPYGIGADSKNSANVLQSKKSATISNVYGEQVWDKNIPDEIYFRELFRVSKNQIIWGANYYGLKGGYIYWDKEVTMPTYSSGELAFCSLQNRITYFKYAWHGMIQGDMANKETRIHPTQKPVKLYKWLLDKYAKQGDKILDTHGGSLSLAIACEDYGFEYTVVEKDIDYYKGGLKRVNDYKAQTNMFK